eukprot:397244_1
MSAIKKKDESVIFSGYLLKKSKYLNKERKRWIVLTSSKYLYSFKDKNDCTQPTETFNLNIYDTIYHWNNIKNKRIQNGFELVSSKTNEKRIFIAPTSRKMNEWLENIKYIQTDSKKAWECDRCNFRNRLIFNDGKCEKCNAEYITAPIRDKDAAKFGRKFKPFSVTISYSKHVKINDLFNKIIQKINHKKYPKMHCIVCVGSKSFHGKEIWQPEIWHSIESYPKKYEWNDLCSKSITDFNKEEIQRKGVTIKFRVRVQHKINKNELTCKYLKNDENKNESENALKCPIYFMMKMEYKYTKNNLNHLCEFAHFVDEYKEKPICNYYAECKAFVRLEQGGNALEDRCHLKMYRHPPRNDRQIKLSQNMHKFIVVTNKQQNYPLYKPTWKDRYPTHPYHGTVIHKQETGGFFEELIREVINNGFKSDLCLECGPNDECKHCEYSLLNIVDQKMNHIRHQKMGKPLRRDFMLSLVLYTGCECNYDLCKTQRNGNYKKWQWFDYCLHKAIGTLSHYEKGSSYKLYSGLNSVKL